MRNKSRAFTLIELLVVVLIIGILAAIAVPQYQKAVEKARMAEAVVLVRAIANAHQVYHLANGEYLSSVDINKLDIQIPGKVPTSQGNALRIQTKYFIYAPNGCGSSCSDPNNSSNQLAVAIRISENDEELYNIWIHQVSPNRINCGYREAASSIQRKLCEQLNTNGTL